MGIFSFSKKVVPNKITNEQLIPVLTKNIIQNLNEFWESNEGTFYYIETSSEKDMNGNNGSIYLVEEESAYIDDSNNVFGWLHVQVNQTENTKTYLLKISASTLDFEVLFAFDFKVDALNFATGDVSVNNPVFKDIAIDDFEDAKARSIKHLVNVSKFNNYTNPPPYVLFAKMIS